MYTTSVALAAIFASQSGLAAPSGLVAKIVAAVLRPAVAVSAVTFGMWKVLTTVTIAAFGGGLVVYEADRMHPLAASSSPASQMNRVGQNPIDQAAQVVNGNSNPVQRKQSPAKAKSRLSAAEFKHKMNMDAEYRASIIALAKSRLGLFYQPLFRTLNLSESRLDQFKDLLIKKQLVGLEANEAMQAAGLRLVGMPPTELNTLFYQSVYDAQRGIDNEIKAFLTAPEYAQFLDYTEDLVPWTAVNALARTLQSTATPLADDQASQMVVLLRGSDAKPIVPFSMPISFGSGLFPNPRPNRITVQVIEQARAVLSVPQMDALRRIQQQWGLAEDGSY